LHKKLAFAGLFPLARGLNHCESYNDIKSATKVGTMAENHAQPAGHSGMDYDEHEKTYRMFIRLIQYAVAGSVLVLAFLAFFWG
jgi:Bacterial aa3 type cytochrome c oxidase subunit IV